MLRSCKYCGRIHDRKYKCSKQPVKTNRNTEIDRFRSSAAWQHKRDEIRERDHNLCQICIRELYDTVNKFAYDDLSVHHAVPLAYDYDKRFDNDYLLLMCGKHHEQAERGEIPLEVILAIIAEQEHPPGE